MKDPTKHKPFTCSICQIPIKDQWANNPWPVNKGQCCDQCNTTVVTPARLNLIKYQERA